MRWIVVLAALALATPAHALDERTFDAKGYAATVAKAQKGDTVDYRWLREQRAIRDSYVDTPWPELKAAGDALGADPAHALELARARAVTNWPDLLPHMIARIALDRLGRTDEAKAESAVVAGIMASVVDGKHGTSENDAFNAVTSGEEYPVLRLLGLKMQRQSLVNKNGHSFDVMTAISSDGTSHDVWFNIDFFFGREGGIDKLFKN